MLVMIVPSPALPVLPLPSVSNRSAIQRAGRGDRFPLGRVPEGAPRAAQSTAAMPQLRPSQAQWAPSCPAGGQRGGRTQTPAAAVPALSVWDQPAQHLARAHQCLEHPPNLFSPTVHRKPCHMPTVHPGLLVMDLPPALPWSSSLLPPPHPSVTFPPTFPAVLPVPTAVMWILFMQPSYSTISSPCCCMGMASPSPGG